MTKRIGITTSIDGRQLKLSAAYCEAVQKAGALPILLPSMETDNLISLLNPLDGVILSGGGDIHFDFLNETSQHPKTNCIHPERDKLELAICRYALARELKVLGICRGMQLMALSCEGALNQYIEADNHDQGSLERNKTYHVVTLENNTILKNIYRQPRICVNSFHHQSVSRTGETLTVSAHAPDGVIEAIEHKTHPFFVGVQWHPECLINDPIHFSLFREFIMV